MGKQQYKSLTLNSKTEALLKDAGYPLGITASKYFLIFASFYFFLFSYYVIYPFLSTGSYNVWITLGIAITFILFLPNMPYSLFSYVINRMIDYKASKKSSELFMLYDLIINELEMMNNHRVNSYNLIKNLLPYFTVIRKDIEVLLSDWVSLNPNEAFDHFAQSMGSKNAKALIAVLKTLDHVERETALTSLKGLHNIFARSQIESYRRRKKIATDLASIPMKTTHFIIILNFVALVIMMVTEVIQTSNY
ncbi:hypothetical protein [Bacillus swezeyi]|nr:hypothetical protein [Bacillus swezeyi]